MTPVKSEQIDAHAALPLADPHDSVVKRDLRTSCSAPHDVLTIAAGEFGPKLLVGVVFELLDPGRCFSAKKVPEQSDDARLPGAVPAVSCIGVAGLIGKNQVKAVVKVQSPKTGVIGPEALKTHNASPVFPYRRAQSRQS